MRHLDAAGVRGGTLRVCTGMNAMMMVMTTALRSSVIRAIAAGALLACLPACNSAPSVFFEVPAGGRVGEGTPVFLGTEQLGKVAKSKPAPNGKATIARVELTAEALAKLDEDTIWAVRPEVPGKPRQVIRGTNICVAKPRGVAENAELSAMSGPMHFLLMRITEDHDKCAEKMGKEAFAKFRGALDPGATK